MKHSKTNCRYCVGLGILLRHLEKMSQGADQWMSLPSSGVFISSEGEIRRYLLVGYSNPDSSGLPNALVFAFQLISDKPTVQAVPTHQCCFAPKSIVPLSRGLYWVDDELVHDRMEDWRRFSQPLQKCLSHTKTLEQSNCGDARSERCVGAEKRTLENAEYKDSLLAQLTWWSQCEGRLQDAIWE